MKGIAHFASGLAVASFVPGVVADAERGGLLIALGGAAAMLPDFLDFRFARFLERRDADIAPDAQTPDPQALADALAREIALARQGAPRTVQLHPTRVSTVEWVLYQVRFDVPRGEVVVTLNGREARAAVGALEYGYDGALEIIELGGPSLKFIALPNGTVRIEFLPWHRVWSHSLVLAVVLGLVLGALLNPTAGVVAALGMAIHILEDQLGFMGSNLFCPSHVRARKGCGCGTLATLRPTWRRCGSRSRCCCSTSTARASCRSWTRCHTSLLWSRCLWLGCLRITFSDVGERGVSGLKMLSRSANARQ